MSRVISGAFAVLCSAAVGATFKAVELSTAKGVTIWDHLMFFAACTIAMSFGALAFEVGKLLAPERKP